MTVAVSLCGRGRWEALPWMIALSVAIQLPLALFLGHSYDLPIFMATGYLAATGRNPYIALDVSRVFRSPLFSGLASIGYPPPWPLALGGIYGLSYARFPSLILYSLAIKAPVIAADIVLALLVGRLSSRAGAGRRESRGAVLFILFNPLILYVTAAWGQFDVLVSLLAMVSILLLYDGRPAAAAVILALAVSLKPTALALLPLGALYAGRRSARGALAFCAAGAAGIGLFSAAPFAIMGWNPGVILRGWDAHLSVAGGLSWLTFVELATGSYALAPPFRFLGFLWVPVLAAGAVLVRPRGGELTDLLRSGLRVTLVFFLARAWLSEPNVVLILPMAAVLAASAEMDRRTLRALWLVPLAFTFFNDSVPQVLAPAWPGALGFMAGMDEKVRTARLLLRCIVTVPWLVLGWKTVLGVRTPSRRAGRRVPETPRLGGGPVPSVSLILPTFNEAGNVAETIERAEAALDRLKGRSSEIIVVDDSSPDGTDAEIEAVSRRFANVRLLRRGRRQGLASAVVDGLAIARAEVVAVMDADLQHPPEALPRLYGAIRSGADLAVMSRYLRGAAVRGRGALRRLVSRCGILLTHVLVPGTRGLTDPLSGYFMVRRSVLEGLGLEAMGFKLLPEIVGRSGALATVEVPCRFQPRKRGRSKMRGVEVLRFLRLLLNVRARGEA